MEALAILARHKEEFYAKHPFHTVEEDWLRTHPKLGYAFPEYVAVTKRRKAPRKRAETWNDTTVRQHLSNAIFSSTLIFKRLSRSTVHIPELDFLGQDFRGWKGASWIFDSVES